MIACLNQFDDVIQILANYSKLNFEVLNDVQLTEKDKSVIMFQDVTVLWIAAAIDDFNMVKLFVERGARINHTTKTNSTAFRCACFNGNIDMARYLKENGADIHIAKQNNDTNLSASVYHKDLKLTTYLIDELGCDINESMNDGRSPLYFAVDSGSLEIVECLLNRNAQNFRANHNNLSPLLLAAEKRRIDLVDAISSHCSLLEQIEAQELLGSTFACGEHGVCDLAKSFEYFCQALVLRSDHNLPKHPRLSTIDVFDNRQECQTIDELKNLRFKDDDMYIEALLVRERILGVTNAKYRHSLRYRGAFLADCSLHQQGIGFWLYELNLRRQHSLPISTDDLRQWAAFFSDMIYLSISIPNLAWQTIITILVEELEHNKTTFDYNLHTALFLITGVSKILLKPMISPDTSKLLYGNIRTIVQRQYVTQTDGSSLLHLSLSNRTLTRDRFISSICQYPCLNTSRLLLQCGANVNARNYVRDTPLHELVAMPNQIDNTLIQCLCDAGAHLDYRNSLGETVMDVAKTLEIKNFLKIRTKLSLKCLCARLIQNKTIPFHGKLANALVNFVEKH
ncbi:unnamed protein product [Rotaria magnacalcarata]|nr:unnamed protein product [Rotaria magnacalcarata]CAF3992204.1 unnamed protein product [Rotaria magnacalcarata]CAF4112592.1 unnamed protein product [Rotaria magnacalcarata]CAF4253052.1 unnamed protein product [Rotaria magnacalcarata]